jgi:hypothetical protein
MVVLLTNSSKTSKRKEVTREENEDEDKRKKKSTGRGVQNYSRHGVREVLSFFTMLCFPFFHVFCFVKNWVLLLQMGARNPTCNVPPIAWILFVVGG